MNKYCVVKTSIGLNVMFEDKFNYIKRVAAALNAAANTNFEYELIGSFNSEREANDFITKYKENIEFS